VEIMRLKIMRTLQITKIMKTRQVVAVQVRNKRLTLCHNTPDSGSARPENALMRDHRIGKRGFHAPPWQGRENLTKIYFLKKQYENSDNNW